MKTSVVAKNATAYVNKYQPVQKLHRFKNGIIFVVRITFMHILHITHIDQ